LPTLSDTNLKRLLAYWTTKRGIQLAPHRSDLDPLEIPSLLPIINLIDVLYEPLRFRHRLVGTAVTHALGRDATGRFVEGDLYGPATQEVFDTLVRITVEKRPFRRHSRLTWNGQKWLVMEAIELPLIDDDERVSMILRGSSFSYTDDSLIGRLSYEPLELTPQPEGTTA
jgi:hypothetical protein